MAILKRFIFTFLIISSSVGYSQNNNNTYKIQTIAFYNLENLFDTINAPNTYDENSPIMELKSNRKQIYAKKIHNLAKSISKIGLELSKNSPALIGLAEVENRKVIEDLINDSLLLKKKYGIVHFDSPDPRGIDVALLYQKQLFVPIHKSNHELVVYDNVNKKRQYTRDQLLVSGKLDGETIHLIVNHWPSRRGGETKSKTKRITAAKLTKKLIDSLQTQNPYAKIIIMGDFNDNPNNSSFKRVLKTKDKKKQLHFKGIYNPMEQLFKKGLGTNAYKDNWSLFDQIIITAPFLKKDYSSYRYFKAGIFNATFLTTKKGKYKGYPYRSFADGKFINGFSDHFPVYLYLIKKANN